MAGEDVKRRLAAIFSADVRNYSRLMRDDETATVRTLNAYRELMTALVRQHHGRVVDSPGDNLLAEFASVVDAVQAATAIQKELKVRNANLPKNRKMEFRIGINLGDIIVEKDRIYGDGINIAARIEGLADPGGICISRTAYDQIEDKLPLAYEYLGEKTVKNIPKPIRAYRVLIEPEGFARKWRRKRTAERPGKVVDRDEFRIERHGGTKDISGNNSLRNSTRKKLIALILCLCFGVFGVHRFYAGKSKSAKVQLFTVGGLGIWFLIDLVLIIVGEFADDEGRKIREWV
ncbi:MAG: NINE protein [Desulfobacteraceae bacterium]|nr:MAG: NINE protein [Desulfobacteraceae bacterium]